MLARLDLIHSKTDETYVSIRASHNVSVHHIMLNMLLSLHNRLINRAHLCRITAHNHFVLAALANVC